MDSQYLRLDVSSSFQLYSAVPKILDYFPGRHQKIFSDCDELCAFVRENVKVHMQTLDPQNIRDYIDCFLIKSEKVCGSKNLFALAWVPSYVLVHVGKGYQANQSAPLSLPPPHATSLGHSLQGIVNYYHYSLG